MKNTLLKWLRLPESIVVDDLDDPAVTTLHAQILKKKAFLKKLYIDFYREYQKFAFSDSNKVYVELGSGGGFVKEIMGNVKTSDILALSNVDLCFSAQKMPFKDNSVDVFFMVNVFHHVKDPACILKEFNRTLRPGGRIIMIEPANTLWGRFIYKNFHHETFDPSSGWVIEGGGPLSSANGAMPWIVFCRDQKIFKKKFPSLTINRMKYHTPFRYLASGGFSMRQLLPAWAYSIVKCIECAFSFSNKWTGMFCTIELQKLT